LTHFLGILTSEAFYTVIESEIKKLASPQKKIEILKSTFRELHESYVEMNTKHTGSFESQYASKVATTGRAKNSIFVLMKNYLQNSPI
jgi:hypothetical protein